MSRLTTCPHCGEPLEIQTAVRVLASPTALPLPELVAEIVAEHGPIHGRAVAAIAHRRAVDVYEALHQANDAGLIRHTAKGWTR